MKKSLPLFLIMLFVLSTTAREICSNYSPIASPDGNYLYFSSNRVDDTYFIYRSNIDGTNAQRITSGYHNEFYPKISSDGTKLVYQRGSEGATAEIFIVNTDGTNQTQLTNNDIHDGKPSFSPDGTQIVFDSRVDSGYPEIFIMNVDGSDKVQLTNVDGIYWQTEPIFNPSGTKIYFRQGTNANSNIISMNPDGSNWVNITEPNEFGYDDVYFNFNPEGTKLVFTTTEWNGHNGPFDIATCNADGSNWQRLTMSNGDDGNNYTCCYSADGSKIYFATDRLNDQYIWDIFSMDTDGNGAMVVVSCSNMGIEENYTFNARLQTFPNPIAEEGIIQVQLDKPDKIKFSLFDYTGKSIQADISVLNEGISIRKGNLHPGVYFFSITQETETLGNGKLIIQ